MRNVKIIFILLFSFCVIGTISCLQKYNPPVLEADPGLLVVDGFINSSSDSTFIRLSRTKKLTEGVRNAGENNATMWIESTDGQILYSFTAVNADGLYTIPGISLNADNKYRLKINTIDGKQYTSDELSVTITPLIDSVSWKKTSDGVTIYVTTHDPLNQTKYYRWDYTETWQHHPAYFSLVKYDGINVLDRNPDEMIYNCWRTENSTTLMLASSAKLSQDVIFEKPLRLIPTNSYELSIKYSMLLRQYGLSEKAFLYLENLKKITEQMGSIFDPQPSQLTGNLHAVNNPAETVIGYMTISTMEKVRIFIENTDVLPWGSAMYCERKEITPDSLGFYFGSLGYIPIDKNQLGPTLISVGGAQAECVDCRVRGGTTIKPDFWQ